MKIDQRSEQRLQDQLDAAVQRALDKIRSGVRDCLSETETNRSDSTSEHDDS